MSSVQRAPGYPRGVYEVTFGQDVSDWVWLATLAYVRPDTEEPGADHIRVAPSWDPATGNVDPNSVRIFTSSTAAGLTDSSFHLGVSL